MVSRSNYASLVVFFVMYIKSCASIRCYDCNSANNSMCLDPTIYDTESIQKYLRLADCEKNLVAAPRAGQNMFCRKIIQTILRKGHEPEVRVTRGCGWVKHHRACYKADNEDHLETVCQCFTDHCNAAPRRVAAVATTAAVMMSFMCY